MIVTSPGLAFRFRNRRMLSLQDRFVAVRQRGAYPLPAGAVRRRDSHRREWAEPLERTSPSQTGELPETYPTAV